MFDFQFTCISRSAFYCKTRKNSLFGLLFHNLPRMALEIVKHHKKKKLQQRQTQAEVRFLWNFWNV